MNTWQETCALTVHLGQIYSLLCQKKHSFFLFFLSSWSNYSNVVIIFAMFAHASLYSSSTGNPYTALFSLPTPEPAKHYITIVKKQHILWFKNGKKNIYNTTLTLNADCGEIAGYFGGRQTHNSVSLASCSQEGLPVHRINDRGHGHMNLCQHEESIKLLSPGRVTDFGKQGACFYCESESH